MSKNRPDWFAAWKARNPNPDYVPIQRVRDWIRDNLGPGRKPDVPVTAIVSAYERYRREGFENAAAQVAKDFNQPKATVKQTLRRYRRRQGATNDN
ncbi:MAG TPA: hypothetical protein VGF71_02140 [Caulobacteraceae bacterium]|jgi:hypothetical protein